MLRVTQPLLVFSGLLLGAVALAGAPGAVTAAIVTETELNEELKLWQKRLHLEDWTIELKIVRISDLNPDTLGHIDWSLTKKTAVIKVLDPLDYDLPPARILADMEVTIVHELVHLQLAHLQLPRDNLVRDATEKTVIAITQALIDLERRREPSRTARKLETPEDGW